MDMNNRYLRMALLGLVIAVLLYLVIWLILSAIGLKDFPQFMHVSVSVLAAGYLVYQFLGDRIQ